LHERRVARVHWCKKVQTASPFPESSPFAACVRLRCKTQGGASHKTDAKSKFVTAPYVIGDEGGIEAVVPEHCPCGGDGQECRVWRHAYRLRKQGPGHRLLVVRCTAHGIYFTLYPPGWTPWGRKPIAGRPADETMLDAALDAACDAASGVLWPRHQGQEQDGGKVARAQSRRIAHAARWLGLWGGDVLEDAVFEALGLDSLDAHRKARQEWANAPGRRRRGQLVVDILRELQSADRVLERLLEAGTATQSFDVVYIVDQDGGLRRLPSLGKTTENAV